MNQVLLKEGLPYPILFVSGGLLLWPSFFSTQTDLVAFIGFGLLLGALIILYSLRAYPLVWSRWHLAPALLLAWLTIMTAINHSAFDSARAEIGWWIFGIIFLYLCSWFSHTNTWLANTGRWLLLIQVGSAMVALILWLRDPAQRATGLLFNANGYGGFALWGIAMFIIYLIYQRRTLWTVAGLITVGLAWLATVSLTAGVAGLVTGLVALIIYRQSFNRRRLAWLVMVVAIGIGMTMVLWRIPAVRSLMDADHIRFSFSQRRDFAAAGWQMGLDRPVTGWGLGSFQIIYPRYTHQVSEQPRYPHNLFIQMLAETGFVGAGAWLLFVATIGLAGWRSWRTAEGKNRLVLQGLWFGWLAYTIHAALDFSWQFPAGQAWWWAASGIFLGRQAARVSTGWLAGRWERIGLALIGLGVMLWTGRIAMSYLATGRADMTDNSNQEVIERTSAVKWRVNRSNTAALANALWLRRADGDLEQARTLIDSARRRNTEDYLFDYWDGILARASGNDLGALEAFKRAYEHDPIFHLEHAIEYARELGQAGQTAVQHQVIESTLQRYTAWRRFDGSPIASQLETLRSLKI